MFSPQGAEIRVDEIVTIVDEEIFILKEPRSCHVADSTGRPQQPGFICITEADAEALSVSKVVFDGLWQVVEVDHEIVKAVCTQ